MKAEPFKIDISQDEKEFTGFIQNWWIQEGAYAMLQGIRSQTLGFGLNDSAGGCASWNGFRAE